MEAESNNILPWENQEQWKAGTEDSCLQKPKLAVGKVLKQTVEEGGRSVPLLYQKGFGKQQQNQAQCLIRAEG
ncbi:hypothetical protein EK904_008719 [Melospiza melodia maxima]|nr:hypothetical protein EK904_008719 [Melospiza melodia maxima]